MKKMFLISALSFLLSIVAENAFATGIAGAPDYKNGQFWRFRVTESGFQGYDSTALANGEYEVLFHDGKLQVAALGKDTKVLITATSGDELRRMLRLKQSKFEYLKFPLSVGKTWETQYTTRLRGSTKDISVSAVSSVTRVEEASGKPLFIISRSDRFSNRTVSKRYYTYAPECGCITKYFFDADGDGTAGMRTIELITFGTHE